MNEQSSSAEGRKFLWALSLSLMHVKFEQDFVTTQLVLKTFVVQYVTHKCDVKASDILCPEVKPWNKQYLHIN